MEKKKKYIITCVFLFIIGYIYLGGKYQDEKVKKEFEVFYSSSLSGKIVKVEEYSRGSDFIIDNDSIQYRFYPYTDKQLNYGEKFRRLAKPGDSIYKKAFSDTLSLIKGKRIYLYTFQKFSE